MTEQEHERLKNFRAQYPSAASRSAPLAVAQLVLLLIAVSLLAWLAVRRNSETARAGLAPDALRGYAGYLADKRLPRAAIDAYEAYLAEADLEPARRANICFSVAELAIEAEDFERALAYLYQAEYLGPGPDLKPEIDKKIALCLDKLGRATDLRRELRKRSALKRAPEEAGKDEVILAEFAGQILTDRDLEIEIEKLPPAARDSFNTIEKRTELLKNLVAERLLLDKALRLELDKNEDVQARLAEELNVLVVRKLIEDEVKKNVQVTPEDAERFYKAEITRFTRPAAATVAIAKAHTEADAAAAPFAEQTVTVRKGAPVPGVPGSESAVDKILAAEADQRVGPLEIGGAWYVFDVKTKTPEQVAPFEEVRDQATRMLTMQKEQEQINALLQDTLQARDVKLYPERLRKEPKP